MFDYKKAEKDQYVLVDGCKYKYIGRRENGDVVISYSGSDIRTRPVEKVCNLPLALCEDRMDNNIKEGDIVVNNYGKHLFLNEFDKDGGYGRISFSTGGKVLVGTRSATLEYSPESFRASPWIKFPESKREFMNVTGQVSYPIIEKAMSDLKDRVRI